MEGVIPAVIAAAASIGAILLARKKITTQLQDIHILVNSRLSEALEQIDEQDTRIEQLEKDLKVAKRERGR